MKRISSGTVTVFVLAIVVGLVAAFIVKQNLQPKPQAPTARQREQTIPVVVAARNLNENSVIRRGDVRVVQLPISRKREGTLRMTAIAEGRIIKEAVRAGTAIMDDNLYAIGETLPGLEARIPPGMRAMPIKVEEQSTVAKMVNIGSRVDISLTVSGTHPDLGELATRTLLRNVEVIAVDKPNAARRAASGSSRPTITVAVTPAEANMLINAEGTGNLDVMLRSPADVDVQQVSLGGDENITRRELLGLSPIVPPPAPPKPFTIEKWEGGGVKIIKIPQERVEEAHRATVNSKKFGEGSVPVSTEPSGVRGAADRGDNGVVEEVIISTEDRS